MPYSLIEVYQKRSSVLKNSFDNSEGSSEKETNGSAMQAVIRRRVKAGLGNVALLLVALTFASCSSTPSQNVTAVESECPPRSAQSTLSVLHLRSPDMSGGERDVWVYRPVTPDTQTLPVLYVLHGLPGEPAEIFAKSVCAYMDARIAAGAPPFVVAAPDGNGAVHSDTEWADSKDGEDRLESFVTEAVIPAVEGMHPRDRDHRAIAGFSMGGYGATNLALRHPDLFGQLISVAGYYHVSDPDGIFGGDSTLIEANSPDQNLGHARNLRIMLLDCEGEDLPLVQGEAARFHELLKRAGVPSTLAYAPGYHDLSYAESQWPTEVTFLEAGWKDASGFS
jgi:S-formylglutathione hydrolase FrmB